MSKRFRVRILCEDRTAQRFLTKLCERYKIDVYVETAPKGKGCASDWVLARYPELVRQRRSKNFQQNLGLLVHVDGDNQGVAARKSQLEARLMAVQLAKLGGNEPVAIFVPTWCIETWLLHLTGIAQPPESVHLGHDPTYNAALRKLEADKKAPARAAAAWPGSSVPSLQDGATEARRIGIP
jgi:hypothetical protein